MWARTKINSFSFILLHAEGDGTWLFSLIEGKEQ